MRDCVCYRFSADIEKQLLQKGLSNFCFTIVGDGSEIDWLKENMVSAEFPGLLKGEALASAYANLDLFVFPSKTDTFGNVLLEALASGVPVVAFNKGGPKFFSDAGSAVHQHRHSEK